MANIRPAYTDGVLLWKGRLSNPGNGTVGYTWMEHTQYLDLDLRNKYGAHVFIQIGRKDISVNQETDLGAFFELRRISVGYDHPAGFQYNTSVLPVSKQTITTAVAGSRTVVVPNSTAYSIGECVYFESTGDNPLTPTFPNYEMARVIYNDGSGNLTLDAPLQMNHSGHILYNKAEVLPPMEVKGGAIYRLSMYYGDTQLAQSTMSVRVFAQTYDYDLSEEV